MNRRALARSQEIAPEDIFLDDVNTAALDRARFEGRLERPLARRAFSALYAVLGVMLFVLAARAADLQVYHGGTYAAQSARNSLDATMIFAPRGVIVDHAGTTLADNVPGPSGTTRRSYPVPALGQIIGYVSYPKKDAKGVYYDTKETGLAGLEAEYDGLLSGENGRQLTETDALGVVRSQGIVIPPKEGQTLRLSVDADLETRFARAIADVAHAKHFLAGAGVIMDVNTGAVRAIVSYPTYDPNVLAQGGPASTIASYHSDPGRPFLDHAVQGVYAPGSIVKPIVAAGALTDGVISADTVIDDPGSLVVPDRYHPGKNFVYIGWKALGLVDVIKAIAWSSDIFFYTVGGGFGPQKGLGIERLDYWYRQFGLGSPTGINLPDEASGLIPTPAWKQRVFKEPWYLGDTYFTAIGQYSMQVTPIQMARATAAIANGGTLLTPTLLDNAPVSGRALPVSPDALALARKGMRASVTGALAGALNVPYVTVAAKTGTAQVGVRNQYDNAWVVGFFPYDAPKYAFSVVLERGPSGAGEQAVNAMRELFDGLYAEHSPYVGAATSSTASSTALTR